MLFFAKRRAALENTGGLSRIARSLPGHARNQRGTVHSLSRVQRTRMRVPTISLERAFRRTYGAVDITPRGIARDIP